MLLKAARQAEQRGEVLHFRVFHGAVSAVHERLSRAVHGGRCISGERVGGLLPCRCTSG